MIELEPLATEFETHRGRLRAVAYRMLGSFAEADDAVQESWLRLSRADPATIDNLGGWLTTVVARISLNGLRTRRTRRDHLPDPIVSPVTEVDPEEEALRSDAVGLALLVVLDTLSPGERLAFVLHDLFAVPFDEIAVIADRSPAAVRQLASRGRRRVAAARTQPDVDVARQRAVVNAFFAASRNGDFAALVAVLDPDAVLRSDGGTRQAGLTQLVRGGETIARQALNFGRLSPWAHPVLVNGTAGMVVAPHGRVASVMAFIVRGGQIVAVDVLADPERFDGLAWVTATPPVDLG